MNLLRTRTLLFVLLALALLVAGCGGGSSSSPKPKTYEASGIITDSSDKPIEGVTLNFGGAATIVQTDDKGKWTRSGLRGEVTVTPVHEDYTFEPASRPLKKAATNVDFVGTKKTHPTDPDPEPTYNVSGKITDGNDSPIEGVTLNFGGAATTVQTDDKGQWTRTDLKGEVTVTPTHDDYTFQPASRPLTKAATNVDFVGTKNTPSDPDPNPAYTVSGTITDGNANPIEGVTLNFSGSTSTATTDHQGKWDQTGLKGSVTVTPAHDDYTFEPASRSVTKAATDIDFTGTKKSVPGDPGEPGEPLAIELDALPTSVYVRQDVELAADVTGDGAEVTWAVTPDAGSLSPQTGPNVTWTAPDAAGEYTITATATLDGNTVSDDVTIEVQACTNCIITLEDLQNMKNDLSGNYTLMNDINASATKMDPGTWGSDGFQPIGTQAQPFTGTFDGGGHTIEGLYMHTRDSNRRMGLFGHVGSTAVVENVHLVDIDIEGIQGVGGLVGLNNGGSITNVTIAGKVAGAHSVGGLVGGNVNGGSISQASANVEVSGTVDSTPQVYVGGLVGGNEGNATITESSSEGSVQGVDHVGGLVGVNKSGASITLSDNSASVLGRDYVGGLVGTNDGASITDSGADAHIRGREHVGGLVGHNKSGTISRGETSGIVQGSVSPGTVSRENAGGLVGFNEGTIHSSSSTITVSGNNHVGGLVGRNGTDGVIEISWFDGDVSGDWLGIGGLVGENQGRISNSSSDGQVSGSRQVGGLVGRNSGGRIESSSFSHAFVTGDQDVGGLVGLNQSAEIADSYSTGDVEGKGQAENVGGLVGRIATSGGAFLSNIERSYSTSEVTGRENVGGLVGEAFGVEIIESYSSGHVIGAGDNIGGLVGHTKTYADADYASSIADSYSTATVEGFDKVGGLVGFNAGAKIERSYTLPNPTRASFEYDVTGTSGNAGGLVGRNSDEIIESYSWGSVTSSKETGGLVGWNGPDGQVKHSYSIGYPDAHGGPYEGGLVGDGSSNNVDTSFWDTDTSAVYRSAGGTGKTTAEMQQASTFQSWDDQVWEFPPGDYPDLKANPRQ